jgi:polyhydroxybutyrate depolymerase
MMKTLANLLLLFAATAAQADCSGDPAHCTLAEGAYHVVLPEGRAPHPAVVFLHGYGGSGEGVLRLEGMVQALLDRGYAVIAPDGQLRDGGDGRSWDFHPDRPSTRDEIAFIAAVAADAAARFDLSRDRMLLAGFSIGGSMTSYLACATPGAFSAYAPIAGSFWQTPPDSCAGPVRLLHVHGWTDLTVPLEGRVLGENFAQGDVFDALALWRETDGCGRIRPDSFDTVDIYQIRSWTSCLPGVRLDFALHPGGHSIPRGWGNLALDWFEADQPVIAP